MRPARPPSKVPVAPCKLPLAATPPTRRCCWATARWRLPPPTTCIAIAWGRWRELVLVVWMGSIRCVLQLATYVLLPRSCWPLSYYALYTVMLARRPLLHALLVLVMDEWLRVGGMVLAGGCRPNHEGLQMRAIACSGQEGRLHCQECPRDGTLGWTPVASGGGSRPRPAAWAAPLTGFEGAYLHACGLEGEGWDAPGRGVRSQGIGARQVPCCCYTRPGI